MKPFTAKWQFDRDRRLSISARDRLASLMHARRARKSTLHTPFFSHPRARARDILSCRSRAAALCESIASRAKWQSHRESETRSRDFPRVPSMVNDPAATSARRHHRWRPARCIWISVAELSSPAADQSID